METIWQSGQNSDVYKRQSLGSRTVMSGSISRGKNDPSQSLQMMERPLMTPDDLKSMPKGSFIAVSYTHLDAYKRQDPAR